MSYLTKGDYWPPTKEDRKRIEKYRENKKLFRGRHDEIFKDVQRKLESSDQKAMTYLVCNYCGLLSKLSADMLFGEHPQFKAGNEGNNDGPLKANERLQELIAENNLYTGFYESALGNSYRGDSCFKVRYAKRSKYKEERNIIIESQNPKYFFVEQADDNIRQIDRQIIAWDFLKDTTGDGIDDTHFLKLEVHEPGKIYHSLYKISGYTIQEQVSLDTLYPNLDEEEETGIDDFIIVHIPNWRDDESYWGYSDYLDIKTLQDEANNRISQIARVLDKHADPKMKGPAEAMDKDGNIDVTGGKYFPYEKDGSEPKYITWEAKLDSAFKQVDYMLKFMFMITETSPSAFGLSEANMANSGIALKYRLMRLFSKIARKKTYYDNNIKDLLYKAQLMDVYHNSNNYEPVEISTTWRDGIPDDDKELSEITENLNRADAISIEEKVRKNNPDWNEEKVQKEVARIEDEIEAENSTAPYTL